MKNKAHILLLFHWLPAVIAVIRIIVTAGYMWVWTGVMPLQFMQAFSFITYGVNLFVTYKLFFDSIPFATISMPTIIQVFIVYVFRNEVILSKLLPLLLIDAFYIGIKFIKTSFYPYELDTPEEDDLLS